MILVRNDLDFNLQSVEIDDNGRDIIMQADVQSSEFLFVNIYAPNTVPEQRCFYDRLNENIERFVIDNEYKFVVGGDFNVAIDPDLDCSGGNQTKKDSVKNVQDLCLDFDLVDIWRIRNPETERFTWRQKKSLLLEVDYWLTSDI